MEEYMMPCFSKKLFGIDCFGCGFQRSFVLMCQGKFEDAFYMYPALYTFLLFFLVLGLHFIDKSRNYHKTIVIVGAINAVIMVVSYFYKLIYY
ncbi:MAG: DUF2752 domain-containing protein [Flavobacterium sp.]